MPASEVFMEPSAVRNEQGQLWMEVGQVMRSIETDIEGSIGSLETSGLLSAGTSAPLRQKLEDFKLTIDRLEKKATQLSEDINTSVAAFENNDEAGKSHFY